MTGSGRLPDQPVDPRIDEIRRRWSRNGGMGNDRSAADYTDAGCRILAEAAFDDIAYLLAAARAVPPTPTEATDDRVEIHPCYSRGPRIGSDVPYCFRPRDHNGEHWAHQSWDRNGTPTTWNQP